MLRVGESGAGARVQTTITTAAAAAARNSLRIVTSPFFRTGRRPRCAWSGGRVATQLLNATSVNETVHLEARDLVLQQQLATFQLHDLKIVDRRMRAGLGNFRFQGPMPSLQFRKMGFYGHVGGFSSARSLPDPRSVHHFAPFSKRVCLCSAAMWNSHYGSCSRRSVRRET